MFLFNESKSNEQFKVLFQKKKTDFFYSKFKRAKIYNLDSSLPQKQKCLIIVLKTHQFTVIKSSKIIILKI